MMMQEEKDQLLTLLATSSKWCQHAEARDRRGHAVHYDDPGAVSWDLTGAVCVLFGWVRARELFSQLERQLVGNRHAAKRLSALQNSDPQICSMVAVQEFNDHTDTTYELVRARLEAMSTYQPGLRAEHEGRTLA
jgi:hypothetical protein